MLIQDLSFEVDALEEQVIKFSSQHSQDHGNSDAMAAHIAGDQARLERPSTLLRPSPSFTMQANEWRKHAKQHVHYFCNRRSNTIIFMLHKNFKTLLSRCHSVFPGCSCFSTCCYVEHQSDKWFPTMFVPGHACKLQSV